MPEWLWVIALFVGMTVSYWAGVALGRADKAPNAEAWREVRFRSIDAKKECELRAISYDHEENLALIERGAFDKIDFETTDDDEDGE